MNLEEIKRAVDDGKIVCSESDSYRVIKDNRGQYLIVYLPNSSAIGLTWMDGITLNGNNFYIKP